MNSAKPKILSLWIAIAGGLLFIPFLGGVHLFDWDEINFAECAREMLITKEFGRVFINFEPFWEKPPLFIWLQALSMKVWGVNEFASRFPNAICGIFTLVVVFRIGRWLFDERFGLLWALAFAGSLLPHFYFHSGIIDPWLNLFVFLGLHYFIRYFFIRSEVNYPLTNLRSPVLLLFISGMLIGLGMMTKGPVALLVFGLTIAVFWVWIKFRLFFTWFDVPLFLAASSIGALLWVGYEYQHQGTWFIEQFLKYNIRLASTEDAGHGGFPGYHVVVLLFGCFPASLFFIHVHISKPDSVLFRRLYLRLMLSLFWVVLIVFSLVQSKIVHYSSLCYFPITFGAAYSAHRIMNKDWLMPGWLRWSLLVIGLVIAATVTVLPFLAQNTDLLKMLLAADPFAVANLDTVVRWTGIEWTVGLFVAGVALVPFVWFGKGKTKQALYALFGGTAVMAILILWAFIGRIEQFSQGTAIGYFKELANKDVYILTYGYKSYAHYFYGNLQPENKPQFYYPNDLDRGSGEWMAKLLAGNNPKDVYVIAKITHAAELKERFPLVEKQQEGSGWVLFKRRKTVNLDYP